MVLTIAACGDDDASTTAATQAPTTTSGAGTTAADGVTTTAATGTTSASATTAPPTTVAESDVSPGDLGDLAATFAATPARLTYRFGEGATASEMVLSQDPTQDPPASAFIAENMKIIGLGPVNVVCTPDCFELPELGGATSLTDNLVTGLMGPVAGALISANGLSSLPGVDVDEEQVSVAGRNGVCFTFTPPTGSGADSGRVCVDDEFGFMLRVDQRDAGSDVFTTTMELIDFSDPLDADFEPLGPVQSAP